MPFYPSVDLSIAREHPVSPRFSVPGYNPIVEKTLVGPSTPPGPEERERGRQTISSGACHGQLSCRSPRTEQCADDLPSGSGHHAVTNSGTRHKQSGETRRWQRRGAGVLLFFAALLLALNGQLREVGKGGGLDEVPAEQTARLLAEVSLSTLCEACVGQCGGLALNHLPSGPWQTFLREGHPMACVKGFCVPAETPEFAAVCAEGDSSSNSSAQAGAPGIGGSSGQAVRARQSSVQVDKGSGRSGAPGASIPTGWGSRSPLQVTSLSNTGTGSSSKANGGNAPSVQLDAEEGNAAGGMRTVSGVAGGNNGTAARNGVARVGSGRAAAPGNGGVPVEVIVPVNRGRRLLATVNYRRPALLILL
ncbi:hypothetical protein COCOBI_05-6140 [Coccomyxa sp. Obi]|nr:hypothetical protein COCOBI_05-6140 [Coccomyxa sp. Obi]